MQRLIKLMILTLAMVCGAPSGARASEYPDINDVIKSHLDTLHLDSDTVTLKEAIRESWASLKENHKLPVFDTDSIVIKYPRFIQFCLNVYNWVDVNFNTYDPEYVKGTGKNGKVRLVSDNWSDIHTFHYTGISPLYMMSNPYSNIGVQANYSILSAGFSIDLNSAISGKKSQHKKTELAVSMARIYLEAFYWRNTGETVIRKFGDHQTGSLDHVTFDGLNSRTLGVGGFYFFNWKKFSFPAAYNLSSYQIKTAGSWIAGITGTFFNCSLDFNKLPANVKEETRFPFESYHFDYNALNLMGGYGVNWVINRHFLFNTSIVGGFGCAFSFSDATTGRNTTWATSGRLWNSLTYTTRQLFVTVVSKLQANFHLTSSLAFMSGIENLQISTGVRF